MLIVTSTQVDPANQPEKRAAGKPSRHAHAAISRIVAETLQ
jgi:hypothetical protein